MKDIGIETLVKNSNKEDINVQIDFHSILSEQKQNELANSPKHNINKNQEDNYDETDQGPFTDEQLKKLTKFLRKVGPLMIDELG